MAPRGLSTYEDWLHCLVELCRIRPTPEYVTARLAELRNEHDPATRRFVQSWGDAHRLRVVAWFERLQRELDAPSAAAAPVSAEAGENRAAPHLSTPGNE
jgi:hypothetical protein